MTTQAPCRMLTLVLVLSMMSASRFAEAEALRKFPGKYIKAIVAARTAFVLRQIPPPGSRGRYVHECPFQVASSDAVITELNGVYIVELVGNERCAEIKGRPLAHWEIDKFTFRPLRGHQFWPNDQAFP